MNSCTSVWNGSTKHYICSYYTVIDFSEVGIRIYLAEKVILIEAAGQGEYHFFRLILCLPILKAITVLLYDFSTVSSFILYLC